MCPPVHQGTLGTSICALSTALQTFRASSRTQGGDLGQSLLRPTRRSPTARPHRCARAKNRRVSGFHHASTARPTSRCPSAKSKMATSKKAPGLLLSVLCVLTPALAPLVAEKQVYACGRLGETAGCRSLLLLLPKPVYPSLVACRRHPSRKDSSRGAPQASN